MDSDRLDSIERQLRKIFDLLDGPRGVVTKVELHGQQLKDIPSPSKLKWHASIGGGVVAFFGLIGYALAWIFRGGGG